MAAEILRMRRDARVRVVLAAIVALNAILVAEPANATWSIVAVDPKTGEVGFAGATCGVGIQFVAGISPGHGAVASQAATSFKGRDHAVLGMSRGQTAAQVIARVSEPSLYKGWLDGELPTMQYGVATLVGAAASYSGSQIPAVSATATGVTYSVQGNTLRGPQVVARAARAFRNESAGLCRLSLSDRLLAALEAGRDAGGDRRCPGQRSRAFGRLDCSAPQRHAGGAERRHSTPSPVQSPGRRVVLDRPISPKPHRLGAGPRAAPGI